jgi:hypothetical protein
MRQADINDLVGIAVFQQVQSGQPLSMSLVASVIEETGLSGWAPWVYRQVSEWISSVENTKRLAREILWDTPPHALTTLEIA